MENEKQELLLSDVEYCKIVNELQNYPITCCATHSGKKISFLLCFGYYFSVLGGGGDKSAL
jgi:hypothetical protein